MYFFKRKIINIIFFNYDVRNVKFEMFYVKIIFCKIRFQYEIKR